MIYSRLIAEGFCLAVSQSVSDVSKNNRLIKKMDRLINNESRAENRK